MCYGASCGTGRGKGDKDDDLFHVEFGAVHLNRTVNTSLVKDTTGSP